MLSILQSCFANDEISNISKPASESIDRCFRYLTGNGDVAFGGWRFWTKISNLVPHGQRNAPAGYGVGACLNFLSTSKHVS